ncbi:hypothetical protein CPB86DRAFT_779834 [Serendipita vermifera]|nr:hypothetical protein CPB86DRAFT_779834 [Serendipita vermifera]
MHQLRHFVDAEFSVKPSQRSDHMVTLEYRSHRWSWEVESLGNQLSASILSEHLIIPLILTSSMVLNSSSGTVLADVSATDLQKEVDRTSKVAQRNPTLALVQALKRPRLTTTLNRVTAVTHSVEPEHLPSVVVDYDDIPESLETTYTSGLAGERYSQLSLNAASSTYTTQVTRPTPHPISRPSSPPPKDQPRGVAMDIEETMYTGPRLENIAIETFKDDGSATESDSEEAQSPPPPKKKRRLGDEGESTEEKGSPAPAKPTSKKGKASGSDSESSMEAPRRGTAAPSRGAGPSRVKQPIKRGGRRL